MGLDIPLPGERGNAVIGWVVAIIVTVAAAVNFLSNAPIWGGLFLFLVAAITLPAVVTHNWTIMVPWPLPVVAAIAVVLRVAGVYPGASGYVVIATLALVIVVELDVFTPIRLSRRFALGFAVLTTLALEAVWIIIQFLSDRLLGTGYLTTQTELQEDIVIVTLTGFAFGVIFYWYLTRLAPAVLVRRSSNREQTP